MRKRARAALPSPLAQLYQMQAEIISHQLNRAALLALDLEMTGLQAVDNHVISIGWVPIINRKILLHQADYYLINSAREVGQSATIHGIRDSEKSEGVDLHQAIGQFIIACTGKIPVFHCAPVDLPFLNKVSKALYDTAFQPLYIDTMLLEKKRLIGQNKHISENDLRLDQCRQRYQLPRYQGHNALVDAIATAELFLAITSDSTNARCSSLASR